LGTCSLAVAVVLTAASLILPPTTFARWLLVFGWFLSAIPLWLVFDTLAYKAATWFLTFVCFVLLAFGMYWLWNMRTVPTTVEKLASVSIPMPISNGSGGTRLGGPSTSNVIGIPAPSNREPLKKHLNHPLKSLQLLRHKYLTLPIRT
jgi:hypothetical protein